MKITHGLMTGQVLQRDPTGNGGALISVSCSVAGNVEIHNGLAEELRPALVEVGTQQESLEWVLRWQQLSVLLITFPGSQWSHSHGPDLVVDG